MHTPPRGGYTYRYLSPLVSTQHACTHAHIRTHTHTHTHTHSRLRVHAQHGGVHLHAAQQVPLGLLRKLSDHALLVNLHKPKRGGLHEERQEVWTAAALGARN